jgi:hypothetical protein
MPEDGVRPIAIGASMLRSQAQLVQGGFVARIDTEP